MKIVLVHGLRSPGSALEARLGMVPVSYWMDIPDALRAAGHEVTSADLPHSGPVVERGAKLAELLDELGDDLHLVAHSMGGLDARYAISRLGFHRVVRSLLTLGTPHKGTSIASDVQHVGSLGLAFFRFFGVETGAYRDLSREVCQLFNDLTPDHEDVMYRSVCGVRSVWNQPVPLKITGELLHLQEGQNDGFVSESSAMRWEGETWENCNHADLLGWGGPFGQGISRASDIVRLLSS